jgi:pimeloyl-ACP methyl ester carboxylesterase
MGALTATVSGLSRVAPGGAAALAERLWFSPRARPWGPPPPGATRFEYTIEKRTLGGYSLGSGEPALLLHGWGGVATDLAAIAEVVAESGMTAVVPDLPGHGADRGSRTDVFVMAAAVAAVDWMFGLPDLVVAHSFGAPTAFVAFPAGGPRRLVLLAPAMRMDAYLDWFAAALGLSPRARRRFATRIERFAGPQVLGIMAGAGEIPGCDVTILHDPDDRRTPFQDAERYVAEHPGASLVPITGAGHQGILTHPDALDAVAAILDTVDGPIPFLRPAGP